MRGWVYVISNKAMPHIVKVGFTTNDPEHRAKELGNTGCPHPYVVEYEVFIKQPRIIEKAVHHRLKNQREGREWFHCSITEAITVIKEVVGAKAIVESYPRAANRTRVETRKRRIEAEKKRKEAEEKNRRKLGVFLADKRHEINKRYKKALKVAAPNAFFSFFTGGEKSKEFYKSLLAERDRELQAIENMSAKDSTAIIDGLKRPPFQPTYPPSPSRPYSGPKVVKRYCLKCEKMYQSDKCPTCGGWLSLTGG